MPLKITSPKYLPLSLLMILNDSLWQYFLILVSAAPYSFFTSFRWKFLRAFSQLVSEEKKMILARKHISVLFHSGRILVWLTLGWISIQQSGRDLGLGSRNGKLKTIKKVLLSWNLVVVGLVLFLGKIWPAYSLCIAAAIRIDFL